MVEVVPEPRDGGWQSRKLWMGIFIVAIGFVLAWHGKLSPDVISFLLVFYAIFVGGNVVAKQVLKGGGLASLLSSSPGGGETRTLEGLKLLADLRGAGVLTPEEFDRLKGRLI